MSAKTETYRPPEMLVRAVRELSARCDGAVEDDDKGFNGSDAPYGNRLAAIPVEEWEPGWERETWEMLRTYKAQLSRYGVDFHAIPEPEEGDADARAEARQRATYHEAIETVTVSGTGDGWRVAFDYSPKLVDSFRLAVAARSFDNATRTWLVHDPAGLESWLDGLGRAVPEALRAQARYTAAGPAEPKDPNGVEVVGDEIRVRFEYHARRVDDLKAQVPGRRWNKAGCYWTAPLSAAAEIVAFADRHQLSVPAALRSRAESTAGEREAAAVASRATDAEIDVTGFGVDPYPFQRAGAAYVIDVAGGAAVIGDEMGLGKTIQALLVLYVLGAFPAVIVCPASLRLNWAREIRRALPGRSVYVVRDAKTPMPTEAADVTVVNYDVLRKREEALLAIGAAAVVLDESHYIKNGKAQRTKSAKKLVKAATKVRLLLSGTPVVNRPSELISQLDAIGRLDDFGGFWAFANRFCGAYRSSYGWDLGGATNLPELNERLRSRCYVRRTKEQVLPELPAKQRATVAVDLTNRAEYERAERELIAWLRDRAANDADFLREIAGLDADEQKVAKRARAAEAEAKARHAEALVRIEALKQLAARGKLDAVVEWVESFLESGEKLVLFAHHREIVDALAQRFGAPSITGSTKLEDRQAAVDAFQADPETRLLVANIRAGGVGLTLTAASNVAFCELEWTPAAHDQAEDRCHRIGQSDSVTAWYLLADRTIDGEIARLIEAKRAVVTAATDGEAPEAGEGIMKDLVASLLGDEQTDITSRRGS